jgi:hypothetical protein
MVFNQNFVQSVDPGPRNHGQTRKPSRLMDKDHGKDRVGLTSFKVHRGRSLALKKERNQVVITMNCSKAIPIPGYQQICEIIEPYKTQLKSNKGA